MKFFTREVKIGLMVIAALFALYFGVNYLKGINIFTPTNSYYVKYERLDGLDGSAPVLIKGFKVGQVTEILSDFTQPVPFTVVVSLDEDLKIPEGSIFELFDDGMLGPRSIQILFSDADEYYEAGASVTSSIASGMFDAIENEIIPGIKNVIPRIDSMVLAITNLADNPSIKNTLHSVEASADNLKEITATLNRVKSDIPVVLNDFKRISKNLVDVTDDVKEANLNETFTKIDKIVADLNHITGQLNSKEGSIGALINDKELYTNLSSTIDNANMLMIDLKENPSRYVHFSVFGRSDKKKNK